MVNPEKSDFSPSQVVQYLGVVIDARTFMASPSPDCVSRLQSTSVEFLSPAAPPASLWQSLLELLSSLSYLVPGGRLQLRSLQLCLHRSWGRLDPSAPVPGSPDCLRDLRWWLRGDRLSHDVSLLQVSPDLDFWSDASDVGWGAHLEDRVVSGLWDQSEALPVPARELLSVRDHGGRVLRQCRRGPLSTQGGGAPGLLLSTPLPGGSSVGRNLFGFDLLRSSFRDPQCSRGLSFPSSPAPQFRMVSQHGRISIFAASVAGDDRPVCHFRQSPLFHQFSPYRDPLSEGTDTLLQSWGGLLAYAFPPWSILPQVLAKLRVSHQTLLTLIAQYWPQRPWFVGLLQLLVAPPVTLSARPDLLFQPQSRRRYPGLHRLALHAW